METVKNISEKSTLDGWENTVAGLGGKMDKRKDTRYGTYEFIDENELSHIYMGDGIGTQIINAPVDDMTREWIKITTPNPADGKRILKELTRIKAEKKFNEALKWSDLYGGSVIIIGAMDGREMDEPLGSNPSSIEWLTVINCNRIDISSSEVDTNTKSPTFGKIIRFNVEMPNSEKQTEVVYKKVHRTRIIQFKGSPIPDRGIALTTEQKYWGMSKLQPIYERLRDFGGFITATSNLMLEQVVGVYKFRDLANLLSIQGEEGLAPRLEAINVTKSIINGIILDTDEEYSRSTANITGIPELFDRWAMLISGIAQIPVSRLFGRQISGLNSKDTGSRDIYYDKVKARSTVDFIPMIQQLVNIIADIMDIEWAEVSANPLVQLTKSEEMGLNKTEAEANRIQAEADKINIELGIYDSAYVQNRDGIKIGE